MSDQRLLILAVENSVKVPIGGDLFRPEKYSKQDRVEMLKKNSPTLSPEDRKKVIEALIFKDDFVGRRRTLTLAVMVFVISLLSWLFRFVSI